MAQSRVAYHITLETGAQELAQCHVLSSLHFTCLAYCMIIRGTSPCAVKRSIGSELKHANVVGFPVYVLVSSLQDGKKFSNWQHAIYAPFATPTQIKTADAMLAREQNEWTSFENIQRACFRMLDEHVAGQYKVPPNASRLVSWNALVIFCLVAFASKVDTTRSFDCPEGRDFSQDDFFVATS